MSATRDDSACEQWEQVALLAIGALDGQELAVVEEHVAACSQCRQELEQLRSVTESFVYAPTDVLRPTAPLWERLARRIVADTDVSQVEFGPGERLEPEWEEVAPGISCKLLATDAERARVSMLVRLAPGVAYPPHTHAGVEELHLLDGELWIDERKLYPGDYNRGEPDTSDRRVWTETGCTCVLITSFRDVLG
jgi:anti-sigma factor ChrR (cupin superfamily)